MNRRMERILVIDDDVELCGLVEEYLTAEGFSLKAVHDGERGLQAALTNEFTLVVLDVMLPGINGFEVLPKPFNPRELVARIRAILRRTKPVKAADAVPEVLNVGDVELDPATRTVLRAGLPVDLTSVEFNLLEVLLREAGRVVTRERLVNAVLSRKFMPFDRSIDMHVSKVRRKLGDSEENGDHIKTIRGVGYMFARPAKVKSESAELKAKR